MGRDRISSGAKFEQNNKTISLNVLFVPHNTETIRVAYRSKYNNKREKQVNLLMNTDGNKWHYLSITNLSALLEEKLSNHHGDFYCLNCFNSYATKNKLEEHEEICNNHDSYRIEMPKFAKRIIKYAHGVKSLRAPFAIYLGLECLLKKKNNLVKTIAKNHTQRKKLRMSLLAGQCSFDKAENKLNYYRGRDCIEKLCKKLKEYAMKIINYEEKEIILTGEENRSYKEQEVCHMCKKKFCTNEDDEDYKNKKKLEITVITHENLEELPIAIAI